ncbi:hypothetical protein SBA3_1740010 [Candidatus Sulfopaludibacter sp. SbA3]|nr:hypothetical protein SBA3_1740010 [Candidatus Sulfopaludibacter sp. SbA3]
MAPKIWTQPRTPAPSPPAASSSRTSTIDELVTRLTAEYEHRNTNGIRQLLQYLTAGKSLHDADKLAFLDVVEQLSAVPITASKRNPLADPLRQATDNLQAIQLTCREEVSRIFSQFATRGATGTREKWDTYVADLRKTFSREKILSELGGLIPEEPVGDHRFLGLGRPRAGIHRHAGAPRDQPKTQRRHSVSRRPQAERHGLEPSHRRTAAAGLYVSRAERRTDLSSISRKCRATVSRYILCIVNAARTCRIP